MAGSQLKRLKASLRDQGIIGPQQSKKQKKKNAEEARAAAAASGGANGQDKRLKKAAALETIREQFNPFQFKMNARGPKFPVTSLKSAQQPEALRGIKGRPAMALSRSEEKRRNTLLLDMQRRNKVGGILDRRLGEGDPNMTPEERALERFAFEKQRVHNKKGAIFDLEEGDDDFLGGGGGLTHMGKALALGGGGDEEGDEGDGGASMDDFDEDDLGGSDDDGGEVGYKKQLKRMRSQMLGEHVDDVDAGADGAGKAEDDAPQRKKTKKEVMEEVIAKSKYYKYERQMAKEADDDVRAELDSMLPELQQLLASRPLKAAAKEGAAAAPAATSAGGTAAIDKAAFEKAYDVRLRQMIQDKKAEPSARTKTEEEVAAEQSAHLQKLEESRVKRMLGQIHGDDGSDDDDDDDDGEDGQEGGAGKGKNGKNGKNSKNSKSGNDGPAFEIIRADGGDEDEFELGQGIRTRHTAAELGFDDEDDFLIDDDLVASGSEVEPDESEMGSDSEDGGQGGEDDEDDEDDEFIRGILTEEEKKNALFANAGRLPATAAQGRDDDGVPYTFPCPQTHAELLVVLQDVPAAKWATVVQRIRALYHPKLDHGNKERLGRFAAALVDHIVYVADGSDGSDGSDSSEDSGDSNSPPPPYAALESVVRHVHSLAKTVPIDVAVAFRAHLAAMEGIVRGGGSGVSGGSGDDEEPARGGGRAQALRRGDLVLLTAAAAIFPTSDHFHQVVTPAMLAMGRYLEQSAPRTLAEFATGLYVCTLVCQYQMLSRRYVPELVNYVLGTLLALAPGAEDARDGDSAAATLPTGLGSLAVHAPAPGVRISKAHKAAAPRKLRLSDCGARGAASSSASSSAASTTNSAAAAELRLALFGTALALLGEMTTLWEGKAALYETLEPARAVLQHLSTSADCRRQLPAALRTAVDGAAAQVAAARQAARQTRRPLELHHHRPLAIRTYVPRFEDGYDPDKHYDPDRARAETAKLQAEYKRERKGALRELRKDAHFLQREKLKIKKAKDAAYEKKYKRLVAEIQGSEGREANAYERERQARRRR